MLRSPGQICCCTVASGTGEPTEESAGQAPKLLTLAMSV